MLFSEMNSATFYGWQKAAVMDDDDDDQSSDSEFFPDKSDESNQDSSSSDDSSDEEEANDLLDDENFDDSTNSVAPAVQPNCNRRNVFMISSVPEHDGSLIPSGKTSRNGEEIQKPECVLDYNNAKKGVDVSDQMTSYYTALRKSLKWHRKVAIEIITGMSIVNAHVLYKKYFADAPMSIRHFRESLALSLTGIVEKNIRPGRPRAVIQGKSHPHMLVEGERGKRKRCLGCYEKLSSNENSKVARNKARRVTTYCNLCESNPHLCISCFGEKH